MKQLMLTGVCTLSLIGIVGCNKSVNGQIEQSLKENQDAQTLSEWQTSAAHPDNLFRDWRNDFWNVPDAQAKLNMEICQELSHLDGESLSLFDNLIQDEINLELLKGCKEDLVKKLDDYFDDQRKTLTVRVNAQKSEGSSNRFKFPDYNEKRDYSNGYLVYKGDLGKKMIALTFDDGPSPQYTASILKTLKEVNAKAHFFQLGKAVRVHPELTKMAADDGHMVGSHTVSHFCIGNLKECGKSNGGKAFTFENAVAEIKGGHQAIYDVLGWVDPIFRFPYGASSVELRKFLKENSTGEFFWNIDSEDWKTQSNLSLLNNTIKQVEQQGRGVLLFHDIQRRTAEILPQLLKELFNRGYSIVLLEPMDSQARYSSKLVRKKLP